MSTPTVASLQQDVASLQAAVAALQAERSLSADNANTWWLLSNGILVFFMQCGFGMLEAGSVTARGTQNILLKNLLDTSLGCLMWWMAGYGVAFDGTNPFIGVASSRSLFFTIGLDEDDEANFNATSGQVENDAHGEGWAFWWFQFAFAAASATIVSGAVAERTQLPAYLAYSTMMTIFVYPVVAHWVWSEHGWLSSSNPDAFLGGALDFAGSGAVHLTGGVAGLVGAAVIGPRPDRFSDPKETFHLPCWSAPSTSPALPLPGHSTVLQALGTFILWMGWYGFNAGSTLRISGNAAAIAAPVFVRTTLSAATGGVTAVTLERFRGTGRMWDVGSMCNGILAGLVSVTAGCGTVPVWAAVVHGFIGACIYRAASNFVLETLRIDDPLDAFAVHGACGAWGVLAAGLFSNPSYTAVVTGHEGGGAIYGNGHLLVANITYITCTVIWTLVFSLVIFITLSKLQLLRADHRTTRGVDGGSFTNAPGQQGFDSSKHGALEPHGLSVQEMQEVQGRKV